MTREILSSSVHERLIDIIKLLYAHEVSVAICKRVMSSEKI
jgi:hypothetical protein